MAIFEERNVEADGLRWHHLVGGPPDARPVVVLHGLGAAGQAQLPVAGLLTDRFRVWVPDLPGFGRSDKPSEVLDVPGLAQQLGAWMEAAGVGRAALLANSMGCQVVAHLAARAPHLASSLVLQGPTIDAEARSALRQAARLSYDGRFERASLGLLQARGVRQMGARRFAATLRAALDDRLEETITRMGCPVLVVRGSRDPVVPQRWAETVARRAQRGELRVVPGPGHCMVYSAPLELARVVSGFADGP